MLINMKKKEKDVFDWDSISIQKYYDIMDILEDKDDDITKNVRIVALILDKDEQDIWNMGMDEAGDYISRLNFLGKFDLPKNPNMNIKIPGYNIKVMKDVTKINVAQYLDFQNFVKMPLKDSMEKILSVFLIPDGCRYNEGYDIIDLQKVIRENLSFRVAESLLGFFLMQYGESLVSSLRYYKKQIRKAKSPELTEKMEKTMMEIRKRFLDLTHLIG